VKKSYWIFTLILILAVVAVEYDLAHRNSLTIAKQIKDGTLVVKARKELAPKSLADKIVDAAKSPAPIQTTLKQLAADEQTASVEQTDEKIQGVAKSLSNADLEKLSEVLNNPKADQDERTLAVELITRHQTVESLKELENFVTEEKSPLSKNEVESVLKAQAIEGIAAFPQKDLAISSLNSIDPKVHETFLKDRVKKSRALLQNQVENSEDEDTNALRKLVE